MKYEQDADGILWPICETEEEKLWMEALEADMALLQRRMKEAPTDEARQKVINEWCARDQKIYANVTGESIRQKIAKRLSEN